MIHIALIYNFYTKSYYKIMNANLEGLKKKDQSKILNNESISTNEFKISATRRRSLH